MKAIISPVNLTGNPLFFPIRSLACALIFLCISTQLSAQPVISSFAPTSARVGFTVVIAGNNFSAVPADNIVFFGATRATVTASSATQLFVTVPSGSTFQPISVTVNGLTAFSAKPFIVTFPAGKNISPNADQSQNSFEWQVDFETDLHPNGVAIADFDGDKKPDLATANNYSTTGLPASVSVLRNTSTRGNVSFATRKDIHTGVLTYAIAAADLDGDGKPDMVSCSIVDKTISVFKNTSVPGSISFAAKKDYATGDSPFSIALADIDGNGKTDIIVANFFSNYVSVYRNTTTGGNMSFADKVTFTTQGSSQSVAVGDMDGDGRTDLALSNELFNSISVFRNTSSTGTISFATRQDIAAATQPYGVAIADLNDDNKADIIVANNGAKSFSILRNTSIGAGAISLAPRVDYATAENPYSVAISDLNGDGKPDIVIPSADFGIFQNNSVAGGTIAIATPIYLYPRMDHFIAGIADIDGDEKPDITAGAFASEEISIFRNKNNEPSIHSFAPMSATTGTTVTIQGYDFTGVTSVLFGGVPATSFTIINTNTISAVVAGGASGDVSVVNLFGTNKLGGFEFHLPPAIASFTPASAEPGVTVTISGSNLSGATSVSFGGTAALSYTIVSDNSIKAVVGTGTSGAINVTTPYGTASLPGFTLLPGSPPEITSFSPNAAATGFDVTITGKRFSGATAVTFGGMPAKFFVVNSATSIRAQPAAGESGDITVTTPNGSGSLGGFTYLGKPVITGISPDSGQRGSGVTITGKNFINITEVRFGGVAAIYDVVSPTTINTLLAGGGSGDITVKNAYGTGLYTGGFVYHYAPGIESFSPSYGGAGDTVTITGNYFTDASSVTFGDDNPTPAASFTVVSPTTIKALVGTGAKGAVRVTTPYGITGFGTFHYRYPPAISSISPVSAGDGITVTITGTGFYNDRLAVSFGGIPASSFTVVSETVIKAVVGTGASGTVLVTTPYGVAQYNGFVWVPAPVTTDFTPKSGNAGTTVTITGINFSNTSSVKFGNAEASSFKIISDNTITAVVGLGLSGNVSVTTPGGTASSGGFSFINSAAPLITSFSPLSGPANTLVTIQGSNFNPDPERNTVYFGVAKAVVVSASTTSLTVKAPAGSNYRPITVTSNNLTVSALKPFNITFDGGSWLTAGSFAPAIDSFKGINSYGVHGFACDLDGDSKADLIEVSFALTVYQNISTPNKILFGPRIYLEKDRYTTTPVKAGDIDGDGKMDIIYVNTLNRYGDSIVVLRNTSVNGILSFSRFSFACLSETHGLDIADLDGDGRPELVTSTRVISIFRNITEGSTINFAPRVDMATQQSPGNLLLDDIDGDKRSDIVLIASSGVPSNSNFISLVVYRNKSTVNNISFESFKGFDGGYEPLNICTGDMDGDGRPDILSSLTSGGTILRNISIPGTVAFAPKYIVTAAYDYSRGEDIGDLNGDGKPDLVLAEYQNSVMAFVNTSVPGYLSFSNGVNYDVLGNPRTVIIADLDGDSRPDITTVNAQPEANTAILRNTAGDEIQLCSGDGYSITTSETGTQYQWQVNTGNGFVNITDNANYTGTTTRTLQLKSIPSSWNGYQYQCVIDGTIINATKRIAVRPTVTPTGKASAATQQVCLPADVNITFTSTNTPKGSAIEIWESINGAAFTTGVSKIYNDAPLVFAARITVSGPARYFFKIIPDGINCGIINNSDTVSVQAIQLAIPQLTISGNVLTVNNADQAALYSWQMRTQSTNPWTDMVPAATGTSYTATILGSYRVKAIKTVCEVFSAEQVMLLTAIDDPVSAGVGHILLFPNPVTDNLTLDSLSLADKWQTLEITGIDGKQKIMSISIRNHSRITVPASELRSGFYIITLRRKNKGPVALKFVKI